jgi:acyl-CoA reductase-like NAD-dependent aldehyde dehydrogenase
MTFLDYAPAPESTSILNLKKSYGLFIGGEFVDGHGGSFATVSPSSEKTITQVATATEADVDAAVRSARKAFSGTWSKMPGSERAKYLFRIARIIQERSR